jgi:ABC-type polysaccharide/polyol phosphate transport system ATPase subunit
MANIKDVSAMRDKAAIPPPAITLANVGVRFFLSAEREVRLRRDGIRAFRTLFSRPTKRAFWALRDVSFEVPKGEIFGIIGGNGAGKSTLLKIIAGIYPATTGEVEARGAVAPLIELGAAVNAELTGAENIFLLGSIYRIPRREIKRRFDEIVEFAGLRRFIETPVKNYSSGMFIRLAFSTIIFFQPDIVLIDEVFSVGDEVFQQKSFEKILSFKERGATIVLVSHDLPLIERICGRALVLSRGRAAFIGTAGEAIEKYHELLRKGEALDTEGESDETLDTVEAVARAKAAGANLRRWGNRKVEIGRVAFVGRDGKAKAAFAQGDYFEARIPYVSKLGEGGKAVFGAAIHTVYKMLVYGPNTLEGLGGGLGGGLGEEERGEGGEGGEVRERGVFEGRGGEELGGGNGTGGRTGEGGGGGADGVGSPLPEKGIVRFIIPELPLFPGDYLFSASAYDPSLSVAYDHHDMSYVFQVVGRGGGTGREFGCVKIKSRWEIE